MIKIKDNMYLYIRNFRKLFLTITLEEYKKNNKSNKDKMKVLANNKC